jgi:putative membrane protein
MRAFSKGLVAKDLDLRVEGRELVPASGPVILAARHYHHLYDGCAIFATIPRQVQVLVGLDWIERPIALKGMQAACRSAGWPVVFRNTEAVDRAVWLPMLRSALAESQAILRAGRILVVFPEGYPTIDPHGSPKQRDDEFLPFHPGFARIASDAWKNGISAAVVPVGFHYAKADKWTLTMRFGEPIDATESTSADRLTALVEQRVIALSR